MRPDLSRVASFYHTYINLVPEDELMHAFTVHTDLVNSLLETIPQDKYDFRYAPEKWTIKDVLQHLIDAERVFSYRALCFARRSPTPLPGFDENLFADNSQAHTRPWMQLVEEFRLVRASSVLLFGSFNDGQMECPGIANGSPTYVLALGYTLLGHVTHHCKILKERYL